MICFVNRLSEEEFILQHVLLFPFIKFYVSNIENKIINVELYIDITLIVLMYRPIYFGNY